MSDLISLAIETSCRLGGVALGRGDRLVASAEFDASARHGTQLIVRMDELLKSAGLRPADVQELYISAGPGSFTGTRIGVTVARVLGLVLPHVRLVSVPSPQAVAEGARGLPWRRLGVILDAREDLIYATLFTRAAEGAEEPILQEGPGELLSPAELLRRTGRPVTLLGEGLGHHDLRADGVMIPFPDATDAPPHLPTAAAVWRVGYRLGRAGQFTDFARLLPIYSRKPEALRLWERRMIEAQVRAEQNQAGRHERGGDVPQP